MKMSNSLRNALATLLLTLPVALTVLGCSAPEKPALEEDPKHLAARVKTMKKLRSYFDKAGGKYDSLSVEDKKALDTMTGSEKNSREAFGQMMSPQGGPSTVGGGPLAPTTGDLP